jgi:hypothetical protein
MLPAKDGPPELEIGLDQVRAGDYQVELRFVNPASAAEVNPVRGAAQFDTGALLPLERKPAEYGQALASMVFAEEKVRSMYRQVRAVVESSNAPLRVRLRVGAAAPELHTLRWELLTGPEGGPHLFTSERVLFSRFMTNQDWRTIKLRPKAEMTALIAVSAPSNCADFGLAEVDLDGELARAKEYLGAIDASVAGKEQPLTLVRLIEALRKPVDIVYLVCHGAYTREGPHVFLQKEDGTVDVVKGRSLADRIAELAEQPRLAVLASCESAGAARPAEEPGADALTSLAPMLAEAGIPAIVAMRGKITMETVKLAMPVFFRELLADGQIDRAMAVARSTAVAANRPDFWMPALYLRLRGGRIWYDAGFEDFEKWKSIARHVQDGKFVAITGAGLGEWIYGSTRNLARQLALAHHFPLAPHQRDDLPQVCQYLNVKEDPAYTMKALLDVIRAEVMRRHGERIPPELHEGPLSKIMDAVLDLGGADSPHRILAGLPGSIYISATSDTLLAKALKLAGKSPQLLYSNWRRTGESNPVEPAFSGTPSAESPVVYQMLGVFGKEESLVVTENDYFDYMIATADYKLVPRVVRSALVSSSLLFLGFQLTDWNFRVLFRLIQNLEGASRRAKMTHVGVQVNPEEHSMADVDRARSYLQKYFDDEARIAVFWGSMEEFLAQLKREVQNVPREAAAAVGGASEEWDV